MKKLKLLLFLFLFFVACKDNNAVIENNVNNTVFSFINLTTATNTDKYERSEFVLRIYYPKENQTKFVNNFSYENDTPDTINFVVPKLYAGCVYEYRIYLSNRSWDAPKKSHEYRFTETTATTLHDSILFTYPKDTLKAVESLVFERK